MPIALVLDTNVLRQQGMNSRNMQRLTRLSLSGELDLYIPDIVAREFTSQRVINLQTHADKATAALAEMAKQVEASAQSRRVLNALKDDVAKATKTAKLDVELDFARWIDATKAKVIGFDVAHMEKVFEDYFVGAGAFRSAKCRDDIPDAVVSAQIRTLLKNHDTVHIAVKDKEFQRHLKDEARYVVVEDLNEFFALQPVVDLMGTLDAQEKGVEAIKMLLATDVLKDRLMTYIQSAKELVGGIYIEEDDIEGLDVLDMKVYGASLNYPKADSKTEVEFGEVSYLDQGQYSIDVVIRTRAQIHYGGEYSEFLALPSTRKVESVSMDGDGICDLIEERDVLLKGYLFLMFDKKFNAEVLEAHSSHLGSATSQIKVDLEVESAVVS